MLINVLWSKAAVLINPKYNQSSLKEYSLKKLKVEVCLELCKKTIINQYKHTIKISPKKAVLLNVIQKAI